MIVWNWTGIWESVLDINFKWCYANISTCFTEFDLWQQLLSSKEKGVYISIRVRIGWFCVWESFVIVFVYTYPNSKYVDASMLTFLFFLLWDKGMSRIFARIRQWGNIKEFHVNWCANIIRTWVKGKRIGRMFIRLSLTLQINFTNLVGIPINTNLHNILFRSFYFFL